MKFFLCILRDLRLFSECSLQESSLPILAILKKSEIVTPSLMLLSAFLIPPTVQPWRWSPTFNYESFGVDNLLTCIVLAPTFVLDTY